MESKNQISFEKFLYVLKRRIIWILLIAVLLGTGAGIATKLLVKPEFSAHIKYYVNATNNQQMTQSDLNVAKSLVDTYIEIFKSDTFLEEIASAADVDYTPAELREKMSASSVGGTEIFKVTVSDQDAKTAYLIASAMAERGPKEIKRVVECGNVSIVDHPKMPTVASGVGTKRNALLGAVVGAVVSLAVFFIKEVVDDTIYAEEDLTENFKYPVIGIIPTIDSPSDSPKKSGISYGKAGAYAEQSKKKEAE